MIKKVRLISILSIILSVSILMLSATATAAEDTTKELIVQGETLTGVYTETEKTSDYKKHDTLIYTTDDGDEIGYDAVTGQLTYLSREGLYGDPDKDPNLRISEEEAMAIADEFFAANCDMSKYTLGGCRYLEAIGTYTITYGLLFQGYQTTENMAISITNSGEIRWFSFSPYIFDDIKPTPIDEQLLKKQLDALVRDYTDSLVSYEVRGKRLVVDENNQLAMEFSVVIKFNSTDSDGKTEAYTKGFVYQIKVPGFTVSHGFDGGHFLASFHYANDVVVRMLGDMNNDLAITPSDARTALRAAVNIEGLSDENKVLADVNNDGKVSVSDARTILRVAVKIQEFPSEFFFPPYVPPDTLGELLESPYYANLERVTSIRGNDGFFGPISEAKELGNIDYIIGVLRNNADSEIIYSGPYIDTITPPPALRNIPYNEMCTLTLYDANRGWITSLVIAKDVDNNTWIWQLHYSWSAMLKNDKDAYDNILEMLNEK